MRNVVRDLGTDYDGRTWDTGRVALMVAVFSLIALSGYDVIINKHPFDALALGGGIAACVGGLGVYCMGDNRRPESPK